jgi:hypothetical protein
MVGVLSPRKSYRPEHAPSCPTRSEACAAQSQGQTQTETGEGSTAEESTISLFRDRRHCFLV